MSDNIIYKEEVGSLVSYTLLATGKIPVSIQVEAMKLNEKIDKLNEYKAIEKELGIDLITLFKAIHNGVWVKNTEQGIHYISLINWNCEVSRIKDRLTPLYSFSVWIGNSEDGDDTIYLFQDYGKTWALTKEELIA